MVPIQTLLADLSEPQRQAVCHTDGPLLVLAGPGSGKTRVITRRVAHLIASGVAPWRIMAITFTNKAADEMRQRLVALLGSGGYARGGGYQARLGGGVTVGTFHAVLARLLRDHAEAAGVSPRFTIYDTADRRQVIKQAIERLDLPGANFPAAGVESAISAAKNQLLSPDDALRDARDARQRDIARIWAAYEEIMHGSAALDFDDLLAIPARVLSRDMALRDSLEDRWSHVLIDEYQDTNHAQYVIARQLTLRRRNLAVVGDPDQSVYAWRGADITNILRFESDYPDAEVIRLEQNYRSTQMILKAADGVITHNARRKPKALWTANPPGDKLLVFRCASEYQEADQIAEVISTELRQGRRPGDVAIFYRVNAMTRVLENALRVAGLPYEIVRGVEFYNRQEIKDALAYLRVLANPDDNLSLERIINTPPRGIGATTIQRLATHAARQGVSLRQAITQTRDLGLGRSAAKVAEFAALLDELAPSPGQTIRAVLDRVLMRSRLWHYYAESDDDEDQRLANLNELLTAAAEFDDAYGLTANPADGQPPPGNAPDTLAALQDFLAQASLTGDQDAYDPQAGKVTLMTLHAAKGLEFPVVVIAGLEQGLLPHARSLDAGDIEEERRLFFVGLTRACQRVVITHAMYRSARGESLRQLSSDFLDELPAPTVERIDLTYGDDDGDSADAGDDHSDPDLPPPSRSGRSPGKAADGTARPAREPGGRGPPRDRVGVRYRAGPPSRFGSGRLGSLSRDTPRDEQADRYRLGQRIRHPAFGVGVVTAIESGPLPRLRIHFPQLGEKTIVTGYVRLELLD